MRKMHERNIYKVPPDFIKLAQKYETFGKHVTVSSDGKGRLNFKDPEAVRELTYTLLKHDFGVHLEIPIDRLIPTVPLRLNYILWIEDLLKESSLGKEPVKGVDIGCGASCIYPLLGAKTNNWNFIASESDDVSYMFAKKNIEMNQLTSNIVLQKGNPDTLLKDVIDEHDQYDFCMCNPPFFNDREEASGFNSRTDKRTLPHSVCTATNDESITEGGEVAFVKKIIKESIELKDTIRWYTSMLGKKASLKALNRYLTELKVPFITHTVFLQGKTTRWGIAWSFSKKAKYPVKMSPTGKVKAMPFAFMLSKSEMEMRYSEEKYNALNENARVKLIFSEIEKLLNGLEVSYTDSSMFNDYGDFDHICIGEAWENTWSHQRQKKRLEKRLKMTEHFSFDPTSKTSANVLEKGHGTLNGEGCSTEKDKASETGVTTEERDCLNEKDYNDTSIDNQTQQIAGEKRAHPLAGKDKVDGQAAPIFKYKIKVSFNRGSDNMDTEPIKVEVFCIEGDREGLHQLFMFLRNRLNGIQKSPKKK